MKKNQIKFSIHKSSIYAESEIISNIIYNIIWKRTIWIIVVSIGTCLIPATGPKILSSIILQHSDFE